MLQILHYHSCTNCHSLSTADNSPSKSLNCSVIIFPVAISFSVSNYNYHYRFCPFMFCTLNPSLGSTLFKGRGYIREQSLVQRPWLCKCSIHLSLNRESLINIHSKTSVLQFGTIEKSFVIDYIGEMLDFKKCNRFLKFRTFSVLID